MDISFTGVAVKSRDEVFITSVIDEYAEQSPDHCLVLRYADGGFKQILLDHAVVAVVFDADGLVYFVAPDGPVTVAGPGGLRSEVIDAGEDGPSSLVIARGAASIAGRVYVCGMARFVYRREPAGTWTRIDRGLFVPRGQRTRGVGLHSIAGTSDDRILAVGQYGEIWRFDGDRWSQDDSPTNVVLTKVRTRRDGGAVIAGMAGTVLEGRPGVWDVVEQPLTTDDFWGMASFRDDMYLANYGGVFRLRAGELTKVDLRVDGDVTTAYLDGGDGVLWSVGHHTLAFTDDGEAWTTIPNPVADR